jgi:cell division protein FtsZ
MDGARSILLSITGGANLSLWEVNEAAKAVAEAAHPDANIIFGAMLDEKLQDEVWVTVVATGYGDRRSVRGEPSERPAFGDPGRSADRDRPADRDDDRPRATFREPRGEPRVRRVRERSPRPAIELDVPEFIPRR